MPFVAGVEDIEKDMANGGEIHFSDLFNVCQHHFGTPRNSGGSHYIFKTPWAGDPRINIQSTKGRAKPYQVRQVLAAIDRLRAQQAEDAKRVEEAAKEPVKTEKKSKRK